MSFTQHDNLPADAKPDADVKPDTGSHRVQHCFCEICSTPEVVRAMCGLRFRRPTQARMVPLGKAPPNACVVCMDLVQWHLMAHLLGGDELPQ